MKKAEKELNSSRFQFNRTDQKDWLKNTKLFLAPLGVFYLVSVIGMMQANNNLFDLTYFKPTPMVQGAMVLYVLNAALDFLRKWTADNLS